MSLFNFFSENIILKIGDIITGQSVSEKLSFLMKSQWWDEEILQKYQEEKLRILIKHSVETVPYYRDLFDELKLKPKDIKTHIDLKKLPILTKANIKKEGIKRFTSTAISKSEIRNFSSSGSTGEPLFYFNTREAYSMILAANLRGWYWMGFRLGDKYIVLSQNPRSNPNKRLQDKMSNNLYLPTNPLIDSNFKFILSKIERYKPKIIRCYPDPLLFLAKFKQIHTEYSYSPHFITTTGNVLHPETRKEIEETFGCKIFDSYSCEGNSNIFECPTHTCYHSTAEYGISEFLDGNGNNIKNGVARLISTDLWNLAHPFIRYETQDLVEVSSEPCSCGRLLPRINRIIGRDNDILQTANGRKFIVHNFTGFFQLDHSEINRSVDLFQLIQKKNGHFLFRLVVNNNFKNTAKDFIQNYWTKEFDAPVDIEIVKEIPLTKSGKRKFIINETI
jgi:phenylacetate-CoA ligase